MAKKFDIPMDEYIVKKPQSVEERAGIKMVPIADLVMDSANAIIYGGKQKDIAALSDEIKENGFKGVILAYPVILNQKTKYRIESGHRRFLAAKQAGLTSLPVVETTVPKSEAEQRIRLIKMNLHNRTYVPSMKSKEIISLMEDYQTMMEDAGQAYDITSIKEKVAADEELSVKSVEKYRQFANLIPELQKLADSGISWSALILCSTFPPDQQQLISLAIRTEIDRLGEAENISRQWIISLISRRRQEMTGTQEKIKTVSKPRNGATIIRNWMKDMDDMMSGNVVFRGKSKQEAISNLKKLQDCISQKLSELEEE